MTSQKISSAYENLCKEVILKWSFVETTSWQEGDKRQSRYEERCTKYKTSKINQMIGACRLFIN